MCDIRNCMKKAPYFERELSNGKVITVCRFHSFEIVSKDVVDKLNKVL